MNEENTAKVKKAGKAKKIIIAVIAIVIVAAIVIGILLATGIIDVNLSKKSKMTAGVEKLGESFISPFEKIMENTEKGESTIKALNNINAETPVDTSVEFSGKIDNLEIKNLSTSEETTVDAVKDLVNSSQIGLNVKYDGDESAYVNVNGKVDDVEISGEAIYDGKQIGVRSEEINPKWLVISNKEIEKLIEENGLDIDELKETMNTVTAQAEKLSETVEIDEKTKEEIQKRYKDVLKDYIKEKTKDIEKEKTRVEVNGKEKRCDKLSLELDSDDIKDLMKQYVKTFKDDKKAKEILENFVNSYSEILSDMGEESAAEEMKKAIDELYNNLDEINSSIDELEFDGNIKLVVYATSTKVYRTDIIIEVEGTKIQFATTFNKESTELEISAKASGVSVDIAKITLTEKENGVNLKIKPAETITKQLGTDFSLEIDYTKEESKQELAIDVNAGKYGKGKLTFKTNISKNEDKVYEDTTTMNIDLDVPEYIVAKMTMTVKSNIKVGDVSIPTISDKESVDMTDEAAVQEYTKEAEENLQELEEKVKDIEELEQIIELIEGEAIKE